MCKLNDRLNDNYFGVKRARREIQIEHMDERMFMCVRACVRMCFSVSHIY